MDRLGGSERQASCHKHTIRYVMMSAWLALYTVRFHFHKANKYAFIWLLYILGANNYALIWLLYIRCTLFYGTKVAYDGERVKNLLKLLNSLAISDCTYGYIAVTLTQNVVPPSLSYMQHCPSLRLSSLAGVREIRRSTHKL